MKTAQAGSNANRAARLARAMVACIACALLAFSLTGCKDSDALTQKIIGDPDQYETDETLPPAVPPAAQRHAETYTDEIENSELQKDEQQIEPDYGEDADTDMAAEQRTQNDSLYDGESTQGDMPSEAEGMSDAGTAQGEEGSGAAPDQGEGGEVSDENGEGDNPNSGLGGEGAIYSSDNVKDGILPENVKKVAAAGPYATMVQALCGEGALGAVNGSWVASLPSSAFNGGAELAGTQAIAAWGDGTVANDATIDAIIASNVDAVLTSATYGGITQAGAERLAQAGINVVEMPAMGVINAYDADIVQAATIVGDLFKDAQPGADIANDSRAAAQRYKELHDATLNGLSGGVLAHAQSGIAQYPFAYQGLITRGTPAATRLADWCTRYIDGWIPARVGIMGDLDISGGVGVAPVAPNIVDNDFALIDHYLQYAGIGNPVVGLSVRVGYTDEGIPGVEGIISEEYLDFSSGNTKTITSLRNPIGDSQLAATPVWKLGDEHFPAIIVSSREYADRIQESASKYDPETGVRGVYNNGGNDYDVLVLPVGLDGSWSNGTFESFLIAPWAKAAFSSDYSSCNSIVADFYTTFFRCDAASVPALSDVYGHPQHISCAS